MEKARKDPAFGVVDINLKFTKPELIVNINRNKAREYGCQCQGYCRNTSIFFSGQRIGYFIKDGKQYYVIARAKENLRDDPGDLK